MNRDDMWKTLFAELIREKLGLFRSISFHIVNSSVDADTKNQKMQVMLIAESIKVFQLNAGK